MGARTLKAQDTLSQAIAVSASIAAGCRTANDLARSSNAFLPRVLLLRNIKLRLRRRQGWRRPRLPFWSACPRIRRTLQAQGSAPSARPPCRHAARPADVHALRLNVATRGQEGRTGRSSFVSLHAMNIRRTGRFTYVHTGRHELQHWHSASASPPPTKDAETPPHNGRGALN